MRGRQPKQQPHDINWHLASPRTRKWLVQCVICQTIGYRADAPAKFFGRAHLVRHFRPLATDEQGRCADCLASLDA